MKEEIDLRTGTLWTSHPKALDLLGDKLVESSVEVHEMMWFDESVEIPEVEMSEPTAVINSSLSLILNNNYCYCSYLFTY